MGPLLASAVSALLISASPQDPGPSSHPLSADMTGQTVLYVGAHPDDEWGVAPILAEACLNRGAKCHFIVAADSNSGGCLFTIGLLDFEECSRVRRAEMAQSAALFGGTVEFLGLDDLFYSFNQAGRRRTIDEWALASGGRDALVGRFERVVREQRPKLLFTLDPRHGSTCHAGHLAVGQLVIEAVLRLPEAERPEVWLEQTDEIQERSPENQRIIDGIGYLGWPETAAQTVWYDTSEQVRDGLTGYDYALLVRRTHASQFPEEASGEKHSTASEARRHIPLAPLPSSISAEYCTDLLLERPTLDIPENRARLEQMLRRGS